LSDFETYRRFLHEGSIVTLHDTNCSRAGVKHVVEHIRTLSDCDVVDFPNVGEGTALVRIGKPATDSRFKLVNTAHSKNGGGISVTRHADMIPLAPQEKEWKYLESRAFATRYVLAAHWVESCRSVIEIGGSRTSIDSFLTGSHDSVLVLDPFIREFHSDTLRENLRRSYVRAKFQDVAGTSRPEQITDWLCWDWKFRASALITIRSFISSLTNYSDGDRFPPSWDPSRAVWQIRNNTIQTWPFASS
jgi:hypothetical protein